MLESLILQFTKVSKSLRKPLLILIAVKKKKKKWKCLEESRQVAVLGGHKGIFILPSSSLEPASGKLHS